MVRLLNDDAPVNTPDTVSAAPFTPRRRCVRKHAVIGKLPPRGVVARLAWNVVLALIVVFAVTLNTVGHVGVDQRRITAVAEHQIAVDRHRACGKHIRTESAARHG